MGSHDFIQFPPRLAHAPPKFWLLMGEIEAVLSNLRATVLPPDEVEYLQTIYLAKGVHATTAIEGNPFLEFDVLHQVRKDWPRSALFERQHREIDNMVEAFAAVNSDFGADEPSLFSLELLNRYHRAILRDLESAEVQAGKLRLHRVTVGRYLAPPADDCEMLLDELCAWLNTEAGPPEGQMRYRQAWAVVKAIAAHAYFAWIHPYADGNGRMARLIEYALLVRAGIPECAAHLPSYAYWHSRERYYQQLQESHGEYSGGAYRQGDLSQFILYALEVIWEELNAFDTKVKSVQMSTFMRERIRSYFPSILSIPQQRRLRLVLDLTLQFPDAPMTHRDIWNNLDFMPTGEFEFSVIQLDRDLMALLKMGLLIDKHPGFVTNPKILHELVGFSGVKPADFNGSSE